MEDVYCSDCKKSTKIVFDHQTGDTICYECGLVLESYSIDNTHEWRVFADTESNTKDPKRVGDPINPLLSNGCLETVISKKANKDDGPGLESNFGRFSNLVPQDRSLIQAFVSIGVMADRLLLVPNIVNHAKELYKKADDQKFCRGRNSEAIMAACLFLACQAKGFPRTLKEISTIVNGTSKKEINRIIKLLKSVLEVDTKVLHAGDLSRRCCSTLGMNNQAMKAVLETLNKLEEQDIDVRRSPNSLLAGVMYMIVQLSSDDHKLTLQDVSKAADVAVGTTKKTYKDLYPYASRIIPNWYAKLEDLNKLCIP